MKINILEQTVDFLWRNRKNYPDGYIIDYPDYAGISPKIYKTFSPEAVDSLQEIWQELFILKRKKQFKRIFMDRLRELGENIIQ